MFPPPCSRLQSQKPAHTPTTKMNRAQGRVALLDSVKAQQSPAFARTPCPSTSLRDRDPARLVPARDLQTPRTRREPLGNPPAGSSGATPPGAPSSPDSSYDRRERGEAHTSLPLAYESARHADRGPHRRVPGFRCGPGPGARCPRVGTVGGSAARRSARAPRLGPRPAEWRRRGKVTPTSQVARARGSRPRRPPPRGRAASLRGRHGAEPPRAHENAPRNLSPSPF